MSERGLGTRHRTLEELNELLERLEHPVPMRERLEKVATRAAEAWLTKDNTNAKEQAETPTEASPQTQA